MAKPYNQLQAMFGIMRASLIASFRNPASIVFGLIFPLIFVLVFGYIGGGSASFSVGIHPDSDTDNPIYQAITQVDALNLTTDKTADELNDSLRKGDLGAVLQIERGKQLVVHLTTSQAAPEEGQTVATILSGITDKINLAAANVTQPLARIEPAEVAGRKFTAIDFILPGQLGFSLLSAGIFATAFVFINLRQTLVIKRFFTTPISKFSIIFGEGLSRLLFALLQGAVLVAVGYFAFDYTLIHGASTFLQIMLLSALGLIVFMGFGFVTSSLARDERTVAPMAQLITLPQFLLAGTFFPIDLFPDWLQPIARVLPLTYFNDAVRKVAFDGASIASVWPEMLGLLAWGIVVYVIAIKIFKWED